ncbi:MAG: tetratricopeptide repeat protein [Planctomycetia bacterium]|nr:tetratricopeptide repeat protein [Planctomycetia bacterium]
MSNSRKILTAATLCLLASIAASWAVSVPLAQGQDKGKSPKKTTKGGKAKPAANTKNLDIKADQLQSSFTRDAEELANQYAEAGHLEKAKAILESALAVNPQSANVQKRLDQVKETMMSSNDVVVDVNPSHGWEPSGAMVFENRPLRIKADGSYKFDAGPSSLTAAGFSQKDPSQDIVPGIQCGALMGMIVGDGKSGRPFLIGENLEISPKESGMLLLRVNGPAGNKNSGKLKVTVSGYVQGQ